MEPVNFQAINQGTTSTHFPDRALASPTPPDHHLAPGPPGLQRLLLQGSREDDLLEKASTSTAGGAEDQEAKTWGGAEDQGARTWRCWQWGLQLCTKEGFSMHMTINKYAGCCCCWLLLLLVLLPAAGCWLLTAGC